MNIFKNRWSPFLLATSFFLVSAAGNLLYAQQNQQPPFPAPAGAYWVRSPGNEGALGSWFLAYGNSPVSRSSNNPNTPPYNGPTHGGPYKGPIYFPPPVVTPPNPIMPIDPVTGSATVDVEVLQLGDGPNAKVPNGAPVPGVEVKVDLINLREDKVAQPLHGYTDSTGHYKVTFNGIMASGAYYVTVLVPGANVGDQSATGGSISLLPSNTIGNNHSHYTVAGYFWK